MSSKRKVKYMTEESKMKMNENFGRELSDIYNENKMLYWKEVQMEKGTR